MSLILDALRKSEGQRQRHAGPGLATVPEAKERQGPPRWVLVLAGLLIVNAVLVAVLVLSDGPDEAPPAAERRTSAPPGASRTEASEPAPRTAERVALPPPTRAERQEVRPLSAEIRPPAPSAGATTASAEPRTEAPARPAPAPTTGAPAEASADARLPRMSELVVRGELNVPDMHLDIHVYSGNPDERFVFINMRKYTEGDETREGPRIERITEAGVVMGHNGRRFVLPKD
jgi:general secretion pathway protein B